MVIPVENVDASWCNEMPARAMTGITSGERIRVNGIRLPCAIGRTPRHPMDSRPVMFVGPERIARYDQTGPRNFYFLVR